MILKILVNEKSIKNTKEIPKNTKEIGPYFIFLDLRYYNELLTKIIYGIMKVFFVFCFFERNFTFWSLAITGPGCPWPKALIVFLLEMLEMLPINH